MSNHRSQLEHNVSLVRQRMHDAAQRAGRNPSDVTLVAVTKYASLEMARDLVALGCHDLAESRPQELWHKASALSDLDVRWHMVGHLQRNKVRRTLPLTYLVHSVDSLRLLEAIDSEAQAAGILSHVLLEANVSGDTAKHGLSCAELETLLSQLDRFPYVQVRGLMTMAALDRPGEAARADFRLLRELRDRLQQHCAANVALDELSMGMSGDFEAAIEEGSTMVRVGSALFEGVSAANAE